MVGVATVLISCVSAALAFDGDGWVTQTAPSSAVVSVTFAIRQQNTAELLKRFEAISDPLSQRYGQHMSLEEVNALVAPHAEDVAVVEDLLAGLSVSRTPNSDFLVANIPVQHAERMLNAKYKQYCHSKHGCFLRSPGSSLPRVLSAAVDFVAPWDEPLPTSRTMLSSDSDAGTQPLVTPQWLRDTYSIGDVQGKVSSNKQAVASFDGEKYLPKMLQSFFKKFWPAGEGHTISQTIGDGPTTGASLTGEGPLDAQYIMGIGSNIATEWWSFSGTAPDAPQVEPFLKFLYTLSNTSSIPLVISLSYGDREDQVPAAFGDRCNVEFQKAGVRGVVRRDFWQQRRLRHHKHRIPCCGGLGWRDRPRRAALPEACRGRAGDRAQLLDCGVRGHVQTKRLDEAKVQLKTEIETGLKFAEENSLASVRCLGGGRQIGGRVVSRLGVDEPLFRRPADEAHGAFEGEWRFEAGSAFDEEFKV